MADTRSHPHHVQVHTTTTQRYEGTPGTTFLAPAHYRYEGGQHSYGGSGGGILNSLFPNGGPSASQIMAVLAGVPVGGTLVLLSALSFLGSLIGLAVVTPLFILFSPVIVPAALAISLAVAGILTSGACGLSGLMSFSWVMNYIRQTQGTVPEQLDSAKRRVADMADYVGQKTKEVGQDIQNKAHEAKRTTWSDDRKII